MANMIRNNNSNPVNTAVIRGVGGGFNGPSGVSPAATPMAGGNSGGITNLRDLREFLNPTTSIVAPGQCPYDHIIDMIRGLDLQDDGIIMNHKIKSIETDFCNIVQDENMLCESMSYINDKALEDGETALKFALLFASRNFDALAMKETKVRTFMLGLLQKNFDNSETFRVQDRERLYNSITLLGEYYHRVRLADNAPITVLGESLLALMTRELCEEKHVNDVKLARLILSQITLNGDLLRNLHKTDLAQLLFHIRKNLIEQTNLKSTVKAIMLMTLDLFYSKFESLGTQLESMYAKYLIMEDESNSNVKIGNNIDNIVTKSPEHPANQTQQPQYANTNNTTCPNALLQVNRSYKAESCNSNEEVPLPSSNDSSYENGDSGNVNDNTEEDHDNCRDWNDDVCDEYLEDSNAGSMSASVVSDGQYSRNFNGEQDQLHSSNNRYDNAQENNIRNSRRSYQPRQSPRPLHQTFNRQLEQQQQNCRDSQNSGNEERDESKPLPRWRAPRFNRDDQQKDNRGRISQRRFSASFDDDRQSIRSEGGTLRLYSINDRLKHAQEKFERSGNQSTYSGIANSNWDRQSQRDDRSERSYMSNYERGNNNRRGGRHYNQRHTYDKPPRFQKNKNAANGSDGAEGDNNKVNSDTWRRSNSNLKYCDENNSYNTNSNGPESNSRSSSRARTLPRPAKSSMDDGTNNSYRRSQSPNTFQRGGGNGNQHNNHQHHNKSNKSRHFGNRYSSQSSLASEGSFTFDRNQRQRNRSFSRRSNPSAAPQQQQHKIPSSPQKAKENEDDWTDNEAQTCELVRNARQTTDYMNYLSSK